MLFATTIGIFFIPLFFRVIGDWPRGYVAPAVGAGEPLRFRRRRRCGRCYFQTALNEASIMKTEETPPSSVRTLHGRNHSNGAGFLAGIVFGVVLGAGIALFLASDRGDKIRNKLRRRIRSLGEDALEGLDRAGSRTRTELRRRQRRIRAELERIRERAKERAKEARETLE